MKPYWTDGERTIYYGDCREVLPQLKGTGVITDPPYELGFMGKAWDKQGISFQKETWQIIRASCLPGAMLLSFGGTRTFHRIACAIEDAGWELRDTIMWLYGSGFPKSLDISKAVDKQFGAKGEEIDYIAPDGKKRWGGNSFSVGNLPDGRGINKRTIPATPEAQLWEGYGTALKPAYEPILVCMNPLDGTFANNALKHRVAGLNIDECRVVTEDNLNGGAYAQNPTKDMSNRHTVSLPPSGKEFIQPKGRFPANIIHDGSEEVLELFPQARSSCGGGHRLNGKSIFGLGSDGGQGEQYYDSGSAARFFYCAKSSKSERNAGCEGLEAEYKSYTKNRRCRICGRQQVSGSPCICENPEWEVIERESTTKNNHPTVKPLALMKYLVKLISPPKDAVIIDPFMGSGSTLVACQELGIKCIGIETDEYACEIAVKRLSRSHQYGLMEVLSCKKEALKIT